MPAIREDFASNISMEQALELSLLVDLEAYWEKLRQTPAPKSETRAMTVDLVARQRAYEAFRTKLTAYNKQYSPAYASEVLLNTADRLGAWCRRIRDLYRRVESSPESRCPVHLLEKVYWCADRISVRMKTGTVSRCVPPTTIGAVLAELDVLVLWCENLTGLKAAG